MSSILLIRDLDLQSQFFQPLTVALPTVPVIQAKLKIGEPDDRFEEEADQVADEVMRMPDSAVAGPPSQGGEGEVRSSPPARLRYRCRARGPKAHQRRIGRFNEARSHCHSTVLASPLCMG